MDLLGLQASTDVEDKETRLVLVDSRVEDIVLKDTLCYHRVMSKYLFNHEHNTQDLREYLAANPDERLTHTLNSLDFINVQKLKAESDRDALIISNANLSTRLSEVQGEMDQLRERASQIMHRGTLMPIAKSLI